MKVEEFLQLKYGHPEEDENEIEDLFEKFRTTKQGNTQTVVKYVEEVQALLNWLPKTY